MAIPADGEMARPRRSSLGCRGCSEDAVGGGELSHGCETPSPRSNRALQ